MAEHNPNEECVINCTPHWKVMMMRYRMSGIRGERIEGLSNRDGMSFHGVYKN